MTKQQFLAKVKSYLLSDSGGSPYHSIDYWYPLETVADGISVAAFDLNKIYKDGKINQIEKVFSQLSIDAAIVIQNQDSKPKPQKVSLRNLIYETDADGYNFPWYVESYYYDNSKKWMIYVSHEFTITFAGEDIVRVAKEMIDPMYAID